MRRFTTFFVPLFLFACGGNSDSDNLTTTAGVGGSGAGIAAGGGEPTGGSTGAGAGNQGDPLDFPTDDDFAEDATADDLLDPMVAAPTQLTAEDGSLVAITSDDRIVYSTSDGVYTIKAALGAEPRKAASLAGTVFVQGRTVFNFGEIDYDTGLGKLTYWTPTEGRRSVGWAMFGDNRIAARQDDAHVMFVKNVQETTIDIVIASADKETAQVLVEGAAQGAEDTCGSSFGFAGEAALVAWCEQGSMDATLARFTLDGQGTWQRQDISTEAQGSWSSDAAGQQIFYLTSGAEARVTDMTSEQVIGDGVGWGMFHPDGSSLFFSVGDQLRKSEMTGSPIPIVVDGFSQQVAWSADYSQVLYSSEVVFEEGTKQDLRVTTTDWFNPTPTVLVSQPTATLGRSATTLDGVYALYLTDVGEQGGTLNMRPIDGAAGKTIPGVVDLVAGAGTLVVFSDNPTEPGVFPALADLKLVDAATAAAPQLLEAGALEGDFQVRAAGDVVAYRRNGEGNEVGIWLHPIVAAP